MCTVTKCGCDSGSGVLGIIGSLIAGFVYGLIWLIRHAVAPIALVLMVLTWRWLSGSAMTGKPRPARFLRGAVAPARPARRFAVRINWAYWPGYQRAIVRCTVTALTVTTYLYPLATALTVLTVIAAAIVARFRHAIVARFRADVIRVKAQVVHRQPAGALTAHADVPLWSTADEQAVTR